MNEEKYKIKFKDNKGEWRSTKSFSSKMVAELAQISIETTLLMAAGIWQAYKPETKIVEICPACECESINTNNGDCYCAECGTGGTSTRIKPQEPKEEININNTRRDYADTDEIWEVLEEIVDKLNRLQKKRR